MPVFLIDPFGKRVTDVEEEITKALEEGEDLLDYVRRTISGERLVQQLAIIGVDQKSVMLVDNLGLVRKDQAFWRIGNGEQKIAGKAVVFFLTPEGTLAPFPPGLLTIEEVEWSTVFEDVQLLRLHEVVVTTPGQAPQIARIPVFSDDPNPKVLEQVAQARAASTEQDNVADLLGASQTAAEPESVLDTGWIVRSLSNGLVEAVRYVLEADSVRPSEDRLMAANLADLHKLMPEGYERREPDDDAEADVLEIWVLPTAQPIGARLH